MRKLVGFELGKILKNKILWVLTVILIAVNILDVWSPWADPVPYREAYGVNTPFFKEMATWPEEEQEEAKEYFRALHAAPMPSHEEQMKAGKYLSRVTEELHIGNNLAAFEQRNTAALEARRSIVTSARRLGRNALDTGDGYNVRKNLLVIDVYSVEPKLDLMPERGWNYYFTYGLCDILVLLLIVSAIAVCFSNEKETGAMLLVSTSKNGQGKTAAAKMIASGLTAFGYSIGFSLLNLLYFYVKVGMWSISTTALSELKAFIDTPYIFSVGGYLILFLLFKAFGAVAFSLIVCMISALCSSNLKAYAFSAGFLGVSYGYSFLMKALSAPEAFHLIDVTLFTRPSDYFATLLTANVFGYPVQWYLVHTVFWTVLMAAAVVVTVLAYTRKAQKIN